MVNHPGKTMTIYEIAECLGKAYPKAFTPNNIKSGFKSAGIYPFDRNVFTADDFLSSFVTDRPQPEEMADSEQKTDDDLVPTELIPALDASCSSTAAVSKQNQVGFKSPEDIKPFPKASPRKNKRKGRKRGETKILTDTPTRTKIIQELQERRQKQLETKVKSAKRPVKAQSSFSGNELPPTSTTDITTAPKKSSRKMDLKARHKKQREAKGKSVKVKLASKLDTKPSSVPEIEQPSTASKMSMNIADNPPKPSRVRAKRT